MLRFWDGIANRICSGLNRFLPFNVGAFLLTAFIIWNNHIPFGEQSIDERVLPVSLACGTCWAMLLALALRLFLEKRKARDLLLNTLPGAGGLALGATGSMMFLWLQNNQLFLDRVWLMLFCGGISALSSAVIYCLYGKNNRLTIFGQLIESAALVSMVSVAATLGACLCLAAYDSLIGDMLNETYENMLIVIWCGIAPVFMAACLPVEDKATERPKWYNILFMVLLPLGILLAAILLCYIVKITISGKMPSGEMNWYASFAVAGYIFFWLSLRGSRIRFFALAARWGWIALLPIVATQIIGIVVRYQAYGLTTPRMAGMATLAIGIYTLVLAALNRDAKSLFIVCAVAGMVLTISPVNIVDIPLRNQEMRLRRILTKNGCIDKNGKLAAPAGLSLSEADAKAIVGSLKYLADIPEYRRIDDSSFDARRSGIWHEANFAHSILPGPSAIEGKYRDILKLLNINESALGSHSSRYFNLCAEPDGAERFDIREFSGIAGGYRTYSIRFHKEQKRYWIEEDKYGEQQKHDVTEHVNKIIAEKKIGAWNTDQTHIELRPASKLLLWNLSETNTLAVLNLDLTVKTDQSFVTGQVCGVILSKENPGERQTE